LWAWQNCETTTIPVQAPFPAQFLADLDLVCPKAGDGTLPGSFLEDLESAYIHARALSLRQPAISVADLTSLEEVLKTWRKHHQQLLQEYLTRLPADDPLLSPVSLFGTMDYGRLETAHTRALAWLLGDREHGFGTQLLEALVSHLEGRQVRLTDVARVESEYPVSCGPTEAGRIDILAEGRWEEVGNEVSWRLVIEAKIDAEEGEEQLSLYDEWLEEQDPQPGKILRVFLTPDGRDAGTSTVEWRAMSFLELASILRRVPGLQDKAGYHFLRYYLTGVLRDVCGLPVPVSPECQNPYAAVGYLQSMLDADKAEDVT
jgi:hypothetical protein